MLEIDETPGVRALILSDLIDDKPYETIEESDDIPAAVVWSCWETDPCKRYQFEPFAKKDTEPYDVFIT